MARKSGNSNRQRGAGSAGRGGAAPLRSAGRVGAAPLRSAGRGGAAPLRSAGRVGAAPLRSAGRGGAAPLRAATLAGILAVLVLVICWGQMNRQLWQYSMRQWQTLLPVVSDAMLIMLPYWWLPGRWRWAVMAPVVLAPLFMLANVVYFRHFGDLMTISTILFTNNYTERAADSIPSLFSSADVVYIALPLAYIIYYVARRRSIRLSARAPLSSRLAVTGATLLLFIGGQCTLAWRSYTLLEGQGIVTSPRLALVSRYTKNTLPVNQLDCVGLPVYMGRLVWSEIFESHRVLKLTASRREEIEDYLSQMHSLYTAPPDTFAANRQKNLIFIIVESLNADVVDARIGPDSVEVTPALNRLFHAQGTVACRQVVPQISVGGSSDGVLIYNTGILPQAAGAYATLHPDLPLPGMPKVMAPRASAEVICEEATSWNHNLMSVAYGYDRIYQRSDLLAAGLDWEQTGNDAAMFEFAGRTVRQMHQPFLLELTTLSMHIPFSEAATADAIPEADLAGVPAHLTAYYRSCRFFDTQLQLFLETLRRHGLFDNTVIVVASDHNVGLTADQYDSDFEYSPAPILFLAANTGHTRLIEHPVGQVDVFPTVLDIMGYGDAPEWRGVGMSMFNERLQGAVDRHGRLYGTPPEGMEQLHRRAWSVSDLLLRTAYFR